MNIVNFKIRTALSLLLVLSISACATQLKSSVDVADHAEFGELKTYAWITDQPLLTSNAASPDVVNPLNELRIRTTSAEFHVAVTQAADRLNDEFRLEVAETIRPPMAPRVNLVVATGAMDDVKQEDLLMSSDAANISRANDT